MSRKRERGEKTVLLVGAGRLEGKLCAVLSELDDVGRIYLCPGALGRGNPLSQQANVALEDVSGLVAFARRSRVDFVVEGPLGPGVASGLRARAAWRPEGRGAQDAIPAAVWGLVRSQVGAWRVVIPGPPLPPKIPLQVLRFDCERDHAYTFQLS